MPLGVIAFDWDTGFCPGFEHPVTSRRRAASTSAASGYVMRRQLWDDELRVFELQWTNANEGDKWRLLDYWDKAKGTTLRFTYTPQDGSGQIEAKFAQRPVFVQTRHDRYNLQAVLKEHR